MQCELPLFHNANPQQSGVAYWALPSAGAVSHSIAILNVQFEKAHAVGVIVPARLYSKTVRCRAMQQEDAVFESCWVVNVAVCGVTACSLSSARHILCVYDIRAPTTKACINETMASAGCAVLPPQSLLLLPRSPAHSTAPASHWG